MYFFFRLTSWFLNIIPHSWVYFFSDLLYILVYHIIGYRKKIVRRNLSKSFPEKSADWLTKTEKGFYHNFCDLFTESIQLIKMSPKETQRRLVWKNSETIQQDISAGKSVLIMTAHNANWEWGVSFPLITNNRIKCFQIYKKLTNERFDQFMYKLRSRFGGINVEKDELLRFMVNNRKNNEKGIYWMISDQSPESKVINYWTTFLHQETAVITGTEQLARKFDYPVYYAEIKRIKRGYYSWEFIPVESKPATAPPYEISEKYMQLLQKTIESQPESWLWSHNRWKRWKVNPEQTK